MSAWTLDLPERATATCPEWFGITEEHEHETEQEAFSCQEATAEWAAAEQAAEIWAEGAWLRHAEGYYRGPDPDEERERQIEAWGPAPF